MESLGSSSRILFFISPFFLSLRCSFSFKSSCEGRIKRKIFSRAVERRKIISPPKDKILFYAISGFEDINKAHRISVQKVYFINACDISRQRLRGAAHFYLEYYPTAEREKVEESSELFLPATREQTEKWFTLLWILIAREYVGH